MRDLDYRRKQEAKHYKKRLEVAIAICRYKKVNNMVTPVSENKYDIPGHYRQNHNNIDENKISYKRWKYALKNNSIHSNMHILMKCNSRRTRRHFQKMIDYKLSDKKFLVRAQVIYPLDIV